MKKMIIALIILALAMPLGVSANTLPDIHGVYGVAIDAHTGEVLYGKNEKKKAYPASITKIMTAMLLVDNLDDEEVLVASEWAAGQEASNYHFKLTPGEEISKKDALMALMVMSANDVAMAIAENIAGSQEGFSKMMNEKAKKIGALNTNFFSPSGLHAEPHYTTAYDMALITQEAMRYPSVMEAMGTKTTIIRTNQKEVEVTNPSQIHDNPIALGGKTGYTNASQNTLVEILQKDNKTVIAVVLKTTLAEEYNDIKIMGDYAFSKMDPSEKVVEKGEVLKTISIDTQKLNYIASEDVYLKSKGGEKKEITKNLLVGELNGEEIKKNQDIGTLEIILGEKVVSKIPVLADTNVDLTVSQGDENPTSSIVKVFLAIIIPLVLYVVFVVYLNVKRRKDLR
jgi:D-alanyl-D-alanine carboxypeptidase